MLKKLLFEQNLPAGEAGREQNTSLLVSFDRRIKLKAVLLPRIAEK